MQIQIENTGELDGAEVIQVYVFSPEDDYDRLEKELKGYQKVFLKAGASRNLEFNLGIKDFSFWNIDTKNWDVKAGKYVVGIGSSSQDIRQKVDISLFR